jgi:hypothetical protein
MPHDSICGRVAHPFDRKGGANSDIFFSKSLVGAVGTEHDPQNSKSRECTALQPPPKSNC